METEDWLTKFQSQGFAVLENFLTDDEIDRMKSSSADIVDSVDLNEHRCVFFGVSGVDHAKDRDDYFLKSGDKIRCFYEKEAFDEEGNLLVGKQIAFNKIGHALHLLVPVFKELTFSEKLANVIKRIGFVDPVIMQSMYIFKQPKIGGEVSAHQDASYLWCEPLRVVGLWFALEDTTVENGCLHYIPNSHRDGLHGNYRYVIRKNGDSYTGRYEGEKPSYKPEQFVPVPVRKGSLVVFDSLAVHRSEANRSTKSRHAYTLHVYDGSSKWSELNWLQPTDTGSFVHILNTETRLTNK